MGDDPTFVGRTTELDALMGWFADVADGHPRVVTLEGEAGIGKSRLVARFAEVVETRGGVLLRGVCQESAPVPYLPLATAFAPIGGLPQLDTGTSKDDDDQRADDRRLQLYVGSANTLMTAAEREPVVVIIDDLHWADQGTLDLLTYLLSAIDDGSPRRSVMFVLATRPVHDAQAAAAVLARAARSQSSRALSIRGLDRFALFDLVVATMGQRPSRRLLDQLEEASSGNPLFVRSLLVRLDAFGSLTVRDNELVPRGGEEIIAGPRELDALLRQRLSGVTDSCQDLLTLAAFLGEGEPLELLQAVSGLDDATFERRLDEATRAQLLVETRDAYWFDHPQLRQLLFHAPRGRRRQRLHLRIADRLEALETTEASRALAIAHHLRRAGKEADPDRLVRYSLMAASHASAVVAWAEAARAYDAAIDVTVEREPEPSGFLALLHTRAAYAHWYNHDNPGAAKHAQAAVDMARVVGDHRLWTLALETLARALWSSAEGRIGNRVDPTPWNELLDALGDSEKALRARTHYVLASLSFEATDIDGARAHSEVARELAQDAGEPALEAAIDFTLGLSQLGSLDLDDARESFERSRRVAQSSDDPLRVGATIGRRAMVEFMAGELARAEEFVGESIARTTEIAAWAEQSVTYAMGSALAALRGEFDEAEERCEQTRRLLRWSGYVSGAGVLLPAMAWARVVQGDAAGAHAALDEWAETGARGVARYRSLVGVLSGDLPAELDRQKARGRGFTPPYTMFDIVRVAVALIVGDATGDNELLEHAIAPASEMIDRGVRYDVGWPVYLPRLAGIAALRVERFDDAARWLSLAESETERTGARVEHAYTALARAQLATARGDDASAQSHLLRASTIADELALVPLLRAADAQRARR